jgi:sugar/nucleoside kinase (ribokinase family)
VDTTGAGDAYAAGFLAAYAQGRDLAACGRLGSLAAAAVLEQFGARPRRNLRELAREVA